MRSRGGWQRSGGGWMGLKPARGVTVLIALLTAVYLVFALGGAAIQEQYIRHLVLRPGTAIGREPWQLLTSGFVHLRLADLFWSAIGLIFFGNPVEQRLGEKRLYLVFVGGAVAGALAAALVGRLLWPGMPLAGAQPGASALLAAFAVSWRDAQVMLYGAMAMRASTSAWIFLGLTAISYAFAGLWIGLPAVAGAAAFGAAVTSRGGVGGSLRLWLDRARLWRVRRRYRVITGGRSPSARDRDRERFLN